MPCRKTSIGGQALIEGIMMQGPKGAALAVRLLWVSAAMMPVNAYTNACYFTLRCGGKTLITFLFDSAFVWVVCMPVAFLLSRFTALPILPMVILLYALEAIVAIADVIYLNRISQGLQTIQINASRQFIPQCQRMLTVHIALVVISVILIALIPVIGKALNKIDTSIALAGNEDVVIELVDEDDNAEAGRSGGKRHEQE